MSEVILDASALIALLNQETGADVVDTAMRTGVAISAVNLSEVVAFFAANGTPDPAIRAALDPFGLEVIDFDEDLAYRAGMLRPLTKLLGLSLGDRSCLALAASLGLPVLTADHDWQTLSVGVVIQAIR